MESGELKRYRIHCHRDNKIKSSSLTEVAYGVYELIHRKYSDIWHVVCAKLNMGYFLK